jgi:hypothetical protein
MSDTTVAIYGVLRALCVGDIDLDAMPIEVSK